MHLGRWRGTCQGVQQAVWIARGSIEGHTGYQDMDGRCLGNPRREGAGMSERARRWGPLLVLSVVVGGLLLWGGWRWWEVRRHRAEMAEIEEDMENGRHATASRKLNSLLARRPDSDEALYLLGTCEMSRGRAELADDAWARVPPDSLFAARAILGRMQIQMERGRLTEAERIIRDALDDPRVDGSNLPILLGPVYCQEGRLAETLRSIEVRWDALDRAGEGASEPAINLVRGYIELRQSPMPVDVIRSALDQAAVSAPDDDRVWLGRANLAIREGEYDEAARWIDAGLRRRPDDVPVWRAAGLGGRDESRRGGPGSPEASSGRGDHSGRSPEAGGVAGRSSGEPRGGTPGPGTAGRSRSLRCSGPRSAGRALNPGRPTRPCRRTASQEGRDRSAEGAL